MIALRSMLVRQRRGLAALAAAFVLVLAVAWAHSGMAMDHMGTPAAVCLAVVDGAMVIGAAVIAPRLFARTAPLLTAQPLHLRSLFWATTISVPARAGPPRLQVFRL